MNDLRPFYARHITFKYLNLLQIQSKIHICNGIRQDVKISCKQSFENSSKYVFHPLHTSYFWTPVTAIGSDYFQITPKYRKQTVYLLCTTEEINVDCIVLYVLPLVCIMYQKGTKKIS